MITQQNYADISREIDFSTLPEKVKSGNDFVQKATEGFTNWTAYDVGHSTKKAIDIYFLNLQEYLDKQKPEKAKAKPHDE